MASLGIEVPIFKRDFSLFVENSQSGVLSMNGSDFSTINDSHGDFRGKIDEPRIGDLMNAMKNLGQLRTVATSSSVYARQKKREASIKRQTVWTSDSKFMEEIQRLVALGKLKEFEGLQRLAEACQIARDGLGPVEQEAIETEQEWEGHIWILRQAEEEFDYEFQLEFEVADSYPALPISVRSSAVSDVDLDSNKEDGAETIPPTSMSMLSRSGEATPFEPDIDSSFAQLEYFNDGFTTDVIEEQNYPAGSQIPDSDSGFGDIDDKLARSDLGDLVYIPSNVWGTHSSSNEFYPHLLTDFESSRDRINKWLENTILQSHLEGTTLFNILARKMELEMKKVPSNWAQLVVAYWDIDGATIPYKRKGAIHQSSSLEKSETPVKTSLERDQSPTRPSSLNGRLEKNTDPKVSLAPSLKMNSISDLGNHLDQARCMPFTINSQVRGTLLEDLSCFSDARTNKSRSDAYLNRFPTNSTQEPSLRRSNITLRRTASDTGFKSSALEPP